MKRKSIELICVFCLLILGSTLSFAKVIYTRSSGHSTSTYSGSSSSPPLRGAHHGATCKETEIPLQLLQSLVGDLEFVSDFTRNPPIISIVNKKYISECMDLEFEYKFIPGDKGTSNKLLISANNVSEDCAFEGDWGSDTDEPKTGKCNLRKYEKCLKEKDTKYKQDADGNIVPIAGVELEEKNLCEKEDGTPCINSFALEGIDGTQPVEISFLTPTASIGNKKDQYDLVESGPDKEGCSYFEPLTEVTPDIKKRLDEYDLDCMTCSATAIGSMEGEVRGLYEQALGDYGRELAQKQIDQHRKTRSEAREKVILSLVKKINSTKGFDRKKIGKLGRKLGKLIDIQRAEEFNRAIVSLRANSEDEESAKKLGRFNEPKFKTAAKKLSEHGLHDLAIKSNKFYLEARNYSKIPKNRRKKGYPISFREGRKVIAKQLEEYKEKMEQDEEIFAAKHLGEKPSAPYVAKYRKYNATVAELKKELMKRASSCNYKASMFGQQSITYRNCLIDLQNMQKRIDGINKKVSETRSHANKLLNYEHGWTGEKSKSSTDSDPGKSRKFHEPQFGAPYSGYGGVPGQPGGSYSGMGGQPRMPYGGYGGMPYGGYGGTPYGGQGRTRFMQYGGSPYGGSPYGGSPYGGSPYGGSPYGGSPYGGSPYGGSPYGGSPYGGSPYGGSPYGGSPYGGSPYGGSPYGGSPYGGSPYGGSPYGGSPYGGSPSGGGSSPLLY